MESLSETKWDAVISGTGLQQSLLALALSRSGKDYLHVDPNGYYGGTEAALSLDEVDEWAEKHASEAATTADTENIFSHARVLREESGGALSSRSYNIALAPQFIHAKSELISQLVSSKAFRQIEFLAVGSFFVIQPASSTTAQPTLARIPSTREDVFSNTSIPARAKRSLMKFLKFVLDFESKSNTETWRPQATHPMKDFLASEFKLDESLRAYVIALTLSTDGKISVEDGLRAIHRHMTSIGIFGAGFAAVYPKWGGLSEIAQVGCRALAVGGAVYMLGTGIKDVSEKTSNDESDSTQLEIRLDNEITVRSRRLVKSTGQRSPDSQCLRRLTVIIDSKLPSLFETVVEGAPPSAVAVVAFPQGSIHVEDSMFDYPIYAMAHSSITGECPNGQSILYLSTISSQTADTALDQALSSLLAGSSESAENLTQARILYRLRYEQAQTSPSTSVDGSVINMPSSSIDLAFDDTALQSVRDAWNALQVSEDEGSEYMYFEDREGQDDVDDLYD
ncbi:GDP dissociation inhibitor domain-containing protein [Sarocladium implicatum]|nr:GDP dissociation inhibitor domain-containing protein [Sarocladium implicatum]